MASFVEDDEEGLALYTKVKEFIAEGEYIKALEILEDLILVNKDGIDVYFLYAEQGQVFVQLALKEKNPDVRFTYKLATAECCSEDERLSRHCALALFGLGDHIGSVLYYKKCLKKAKLAKSLADPESPEDAAVEGLVELQRAKKIQSPESLIKSAEARIAGGCKTSSVKHSESKVLESENRPKQDSTEVKEIRSYWLSLDVKMRKEFMKVSIADLKRFVKGTMNREGQDVLEEVLASAKTDGKWTFWMCRSLCEKKFSSADECLKHLEEHHAAGFKPSSEMKKVEMIGKDWARKISVGHWKPVDAEAAVEMIENQFEYVKAFASRSKNGWSEEWPLAEDDERSKLLEEIKLLLVSLYGQKILPRSIRDWMMVFPVEQLTKLQVSEQSIYDLRIVETPQSICFLECRELSHILDVLKSVKCERNDGTDLVCRAVDYFLGRTRVREKIDFDSEYSLLLLDRRLLKSKNVPFIDDVAIYTFDPNVHYAKATVQGDDIISWLVDYSSLDKIFPRPIREHNLDLWVAVMKAVQFTCRTLGTKYAKKMQFLDYEAALTDVENLCMNKDGIGKNIQGNQGNGYASLLYDECEKRVSFTKMNGYNGNTISTELFLCVVQDVLEGALDPRFDLPDLDRICERKCLSDDWVLKSIRLLKSEIFHKVLLIDSKILLIDNSRTILLENLTRLSVFDNRTYMLRLLKPFILSEIQTMASKAMSDAAVAELLLEEKISLPMEKMSQPKEKMSQSRKKKNGKNKGASRSVSNSLDQTVELQPSVNREPEVTSPSLKAVEEEPTEPDDTITSERSQLEILSNIDNQEEVVQVSLSEYLESALGGASAGYISALDMTLKALLNMKILKKDLNHNKQPSLEEQEGQVPFALQNFFTAFGSDEIEEVYSVLLSDLLASLKQVISMSGDAAEVLVTILQFWPCFKNPEIESLVTRLFKLEENERMTCRKCRRMPNYSEQSSYGIVMAADAIRDLKCAFGNMKFVDILKGIRMEYKMLCDVKTGGCGMTNFFHHFITRRPPIFTIVLEWEKRETGKEIAETAMALEWEIDISRLYEGLEPNTNYRLVSMVGCGDEDERICLAYGTNRRWVNLIRDSLAGKDVGNWKNVVKFCEERMVRPEILFYEATCSVV